MCTYTSIPYTQSYSAPTCENMYYAPLSNVSVGIYCMRSALATRHLPHRNFLFILVFLFTALSFALAPQQVYKQLFAITVIFFFL